MERRYGLSAAALKYLAAALMLLDHADAAFHLMAQWAGPESLLYYLPRCVGRLAFPVFAYFVAEGCRRTHYFPKYLLRLGIFAAVSQIPFCLLRGELGGSTILTFFLAAGAVYAFQRLSQRENTNLYVATLPLLGACVLAMVLQVDYSFPAVLLVFALYLCGEDRNKLLLCLGAGLALIYLVYTPLMGILTLPALLPDLIRLYLGKAMPLCLLYALGAEASLLLLARYDGRLGVQNKWFFYWFYPLHLLALWLVGRLIV